MTPLLALVVAPFAAANDFAVVLHGVIEQTLSPVTGPFANTTVGDRFTLRLVVDDAPTVISSTQWTYGIEFSRGGLTIEDELVSFDGLAQTTVFSMLDDGPGIGDSIDFYCGLAQSNLDVQFLIRDSGGAMLGSPSVAAAAGVLTIPSASNLAQLVLRGPGQAVTTIGHVYFAEVVDLAAQPGENLCVAEANASGRPARVAARGSVSVAANSMALDCFHMPTSVFGYFLVARDGGFTVAPGNSRGTLCLGGEIGRYARDVLSSGAAGAFSLALDLTNVPQPSGAVAVLPGDTWRFQCWYRDFAGASPTSNFSDAVWVRFE